MPVERNKTSRQKNDSSKKLTAVENADIPERGPVQPSQSQKQGVTHLVECSCVLPQYLQRKDPIFHRFIVFSIIDENDNVEEKIVQCNNCGIVHRVTDICRSEIIYGRDESRGAVTINDVRWSMSQRLADILDANDCELYIWEQVKFIIDEERWGERVILSSEEVDGRHVGKFLTIAGPEKFGIAQYSEDLEISTSA